ncbi:hypothetical protein TIFTF001_049175 [Ficus carica]|uniref:Uncharacterized protein n=1 Tax=Ficus carica TaxID=3494 RepID=A0AA87YW17_FICCA|nr:hypothetical protein TIFTF001_049175 [Ficus carica]
MEYPIPLTAEELNLFHNIDGKVFARLACDVGFSHASAMRVVAFWNWLETCGHADVVAKALPLSPFMLRALAKEGIRCMQFLKTEGMAPLPYYPDDFQLLFMPSFLGCDFSLCFLRANMEISTVAMGQIDRFVQFMFKKITVSHHVTGDGVVYGTQVPALLFYEHQMWSVLRAFLCGCSTPLFHRRLSTSDENPLSNSK